MIKIDEDTARWIVLLLERASNIDEGTLAELAQDAERHINTSPSDVCALQLWSLRNDEGFSTIAKDAQKIAQQLAEQIQNPLSGAEEASLVETIAQAVQAPYGRNIIAGKTFDTLKRALLNSTELVGLEERLRHRHLHCASCGKEFHSQEMATVSIESLGGDSSFWCSRCKRPARVACAKHKCNGSVALDPSRNVDWKKLNECEEHKGEKTNPGLNTIEEAPSILQQWAQTLSTPLAIEEDNPFLPRTERIRFSPAPPTRTRNR